MWPFKTPKESKSEGKRPGKRTEVTSKYASKQRQNNGNTGGNKSKHQQPAKYTRLSEEEGQIILELRDEGLSMRAIADELGRSSGTIHKFCKRQGLSSSVKSGNGGLSKSNPIGEHPEERLADSLVRQLGPILAEDLREFLRENPEVRDQLLWGCLDLTPPKRTLDDRVERWIADSPEFLRRIADHKLVQMERGGRTEMDILKEGLALRKEELALLAAFSELSHKGDWPAVVRDLGTSGALGEIVDSFVSLKRGSTEVISKPTQPPLDVQNPGLCSPEELADKAPLADSPVYLPDPETEKEGFLNSAITLPQDQTDLKGIRIEPLRPWPRKPNNPELVAVICVDMSAELAEFKNSPGKLSPAATPTSPHDSDTEKGVSLNSDKTPAHDQAKNVRTEFRPQKSKKHNSKSLADFLRERYPDKSEKLAEVKDNLGELSLAATPTSLHDSDTEKGVSLNSDKTPAHDQAKNVRTEFRPQKSKKHNARLVAVIRADMSAELAEFKRLQLKSIGPSPRTDSEAEGC